MLTLYTYAWVPDFAAPLMRAFRVRWALEEAGRPYAVCHVALGAEQRSAAHLVRQPFGQAPAIEDDGLVLHESGAIVLHIAADSECLLPRERVGRARATAWVFSALNTVENVVQELGAIDFFHAQEAWAIERRPQVEADVRDRLALLSRALGDKPWLEQRFTVGDLMMGDVLRILDHTRLLEQFPSLLAYKRRCESRPAFQRALQAQLQGFKAAG
jgi:glutathione S-transferase